MNQQQDTAKDKIANTLQGVTEVDYGTSYREHTLEIYKIYLEMADRISQRREKTNTFFLAVNAALIALLTKNTFGDGSHTPSLVILVPMTAAFLCYLWYRIIKSYRDLNSAKFKVIHAIEQQLPLRPYDAEWESVERGKTPKLYSPFTKVERIVPWVFMGLHFLLFVLALPWKQIYQYINSK